MKQEQNHGQTKTLCGAYPGCLIPDQVVVVSTDSYDKAVDQAKGMVSDVLERFHNLQPKDYTMNVLRVTHSNRGA